MDANPEDTRKAVFQAQRLAALGQMASGIAHDFNNSLQAAMLTLEVAERRLTQHRSTECHRLLGTASASLRRASASSVRLLAFASSRQDLPRPIDVNELVDNLQELLRTALGSSGRLFLALAEDLPQIICHAHDLENALLNMVINARDAMPGGGSVRIAGHRATLHTKADGLEAGVYVVLEVVDTGLGMEPETLRRACAPFFTTKPEGQGTGLGLAMVRAFVEQQHGQIAIESAVGCGTTFRIFLPALA